MFGTCIEPYGPSLHGAVFLLCYRSCNFRAYLARHWGQGRDARRNV